MNLEQFQLFVDLDGVLVDFDAGVKKITGSLPSTMHPRKMWPILANSPHFYEQLDWMEDGKTLWEVLKNHNPVILTGLPIGKWAETQKRAWCNRELGASVPVITGLSRKKAELAQEWKQEHGCANRTSLLIDDRVKIKENWGKSGGVFILHTSAEDSLKQLESLGFPL